MIRRRHDPAGREPMLHQRLFAYLHTFAWPELTVRELLIRYRSRISWPLGLLIIGVYFRFGEGLTVYANGFALLFWTASLLVLPVALHAGVRTMVLKHRNPDLPGRPIWFAVGKLVVTVVGLAVYLFI
ncbi:hypothetical protein F8O07_06815 [Pseudoclavibacter sp. CFCC 13796]|uniref:hypothetical protein n=1 Tax=Pseudoclavibacter sp. CFCC 13796 TaxID=2615179 RepID=UPI0013015807|nr:hypothetical protein [Pseudoclavibacter sp. CFCC 13796]KAB1661610.1 hypothetical protein F8O07_06815 [Pseudoclavibacter sp. CFCC 13796]